MVEVTPLASDLLVRAAHKRDCLAAPLAALRAAGDTPLRFGKPLLRMAVVAGMLDHLTLGGDEDHLEPHIDAGLASGERQRSGGHLGARAAGVPAICLAADR